MAGGVGKKAIFLFVLFVASAFAGTTGGGLEGLWNEAVDILGDKYLGYLIAGYQLYDAYRLRVTGETGKAVERLIYAGAFGGFATLAEQTAGALIA
ncbi:MAG: hypothetical protein AABY36_06235 [Campylobacterota bacterium]|jgi:hypothetical protein